ncbi:Phospholipase_D-nuclease N-terminal [Sanguibacter gelidistatuariae]|uniref:Phospholipase_D-nuclease N-terminal n=1 Tax=Sanguibacter gelidistatuariae TaxID=1814289 RepID=A0A1G6X2J8_9MICO|nr:PLD nuclease N-terminal domain-containing protein [Sanguibacter gelidistatuariae]SDD72412.1 Phospholipase_D-nuclease N-terminal [Sanguibacter gelidistatuariae]
MFRALAVIAAFALLVYALADFASSDERDRGGIPGWLWAVIIILLPYFGPLSWIVFSRSRRRQGAGPGHPSAGTSPRTRRRPSGPLAPDDDPEFLWRLAREQRRQARPAADAGTSNAAPDDTSARDHSTHDHDHGAHDQTTPPELRDDQGPDTKPTA